MPEFRQNPTSREWVIISPNIRFPFVELRKRRAPTPSYDKSCSFCPGNEKLAPKEVYRVPENGGWKVRIIQDQGSPLRSNFSTSDEGQNFFMTTSENSGVAEVVIVSPDHNKSIAHMQLEEVTAILTAYRARYQALLESGRHKVITIFHNHGLAAGAVAPHPHSRIVAMPIIPANMRRLAEQSLAYFKRSGRCFHCDMIHNEHKLRERMIIESDNFVAFCPFAASSPFETVIYPRRHAAGFAQIDNDEIEELGWIFRTVTLKIFNCLDDPDYYYVVKSAPVGEENAPYLHWHIEITPRISAPIGFALGTGINVNMVAPEVAAGHLREISTDC